MNKVRTKQKLHFNSSPRNFHKTRAAPEKKKGKILEKFPLVVLELRNQHFSN